MKNGLTGFQRLAVVLLIASATSIGTTVWAYSELQAQEQRVSAALAAFSAAPQNLRTDESDAGQEVLYANLQAIEKGGFYLAMRKWTGWGHFVAALLVAVVWVTEGFLRQRQAQSDLKA